MSDIVPGDYVTMKNSRLFPQDGALVLTVNFLQRKPEYVLIDAEDTTNIGWWRLPESKVQQIIHDGTNYGNYDFIENLSSWINKKVFWLIYKVAYLVTSKVEVYLPNRNKPYIMDISKPSIGKIISATDLIGKISTYEIVELTEDKNIAWAEKI